MKKIVCLLLAIIAFIICLPISFFIALIFLSFYNGIGLDGGLFQLIVVIILCAGLSFEGAKFVYLKLNNLTQNSSDKTSLSE